MHEIRIYALYIRKVLNNRNFQLSPISLNGLGCEYQKTDDMFPFKFCETFTTNFIPVTSNAYINVCLVNLSLTGNSTVNVNGKGSLLF